MKNRVKTNWWLLLLTGIVFTVLSFKIMTHPAESIIGLAFFIGWACTFSGIFQIGFSLSAKGIHSNWKWRLFNGIINIIFGLIFLSHPGLTAKALPFIFGFWMVFVGIATFFTGIKEKTNKVQGGWFDMLLGIFITVGGIWVSYNPGIEAAMLIWILALWFMMYGLYFIIGSLILSKVR